MTCLGLRPWDFPGKSTGVGCHGISNFLEEISSLSCSVVFLYLFAWIAEEGFLISSCYSLELCEGNEGFPPPPEKDLESPSSMRLEALVPSSDSSAMTRSPSPRAWRPDFPGAAREAP